MNRLLIASILLISTAPLFAQAKPDPAKLKADAQKVISGISVDQAKIEAYCEVTDLGGQAVEAAQEKDEKKADALMQRVDELEKILGPEYPALFNALYDADPNSKDVQDLVDVRYARPVLSELAVIVQASIVDEMRVLDVLEKRGVEFIENGVRLTRRPRR
jgi:hypothetical protein